MIRLIPQPKEVIPKEGICADPSNVKSFKDPSVKNPEGYRLDITKDGVYVYASCEKGLFYAGKTLEQLEMQYGGSLPCLTVKDEPAFAYRGFMLDCARHMIAVDEIKRMADAAAMLKLNVFHWHLSDDQGFRIELESFPELTERGSVRKCDSFGSLCRSSEPYGGYYTREEIKDVISYCSERFIEVVPELDMPGHTSAILHVFPSLGCRRADVDVKTRQGIYKDNICTGSDGALEFAKKLLGELCELFPYEYVHIGGDEAPDDFRNSCPDCQRKIKEKGLGCSADLKCDFSNELKKAAGEYGKKAIVWNDVLKGGGLDRDITVQRWMDPKNLAIRAANEGYRIIISDFKPYYFDYPYGMYPLCTVYGFNPAGHRGLTAQGRKNIIGTETPLWTEFVDNPGRLEYLCLPRWFAFAENAWTPQENKNYGEFRAAEKKLSAYLKSKGYSPAPEKDLDMPLPVRLYDTAKFFRAFLSK